MIWNKRSTVTASQLVEFEELFPSLRLAKSSRWARRMATWLGLLLLAIVCFTAFAPWQQFVGGSFVPDPCQFGSFKRKLPGWRKSYADECCSVKKD